MIPNELYVYHEGRHYMASRNVQCVSNDMYSCNAYMVSFFRCSDPSCYYTAGKEINKASIKYSFPTMKWLPTTGIKSVSTPQWNFVHTQHSTSTWECYLSYNKKFQAWGSPSAHCLLGCKMLHELALALLMMYVILSIGRIPNMTDENEPCYYICDKSRDLNPISNLLLT